MVTKKTHAVFRVPNYGAKNRKGVKPRWRKQRGIDSKLRIDLSGYGQTPKVGYKNPEAVRFVRKDGLKTQLVHNQKELEALFTQSKKYSVVLSHDLSVRKKAELQKMAESKGLKVVNKLKLKAAEVVKTKAKPKQQQAATATATAHATPNEAPKAAAAVEAPAPKAQAPKEDKV
ncbi:50S ribosomal protein L32e [uncultured archaeon]|nr:50S ribosomal protein L32e [uncultured archaeon]